MDTRTGSIADFQKLHALGLTAPEPVERYTKPVDPANLSAANRALLEQAGQVTVSRNSPCPCGSRKRFKRCCMTA